MPDAPDGIAAMRSRMTRGQRVPPRPRSRTLPATVLDDAAAAVTDAPAAPPPPAVSAPRARSAPARQAARTQVLRVPADAPAVNLAIRVRRPLDDALVDVIHDLRRRDVRTSKVELIELLLWELVGQPGDVVTRLGAFRAAAPRAAQAPLPGQDGPR